MYWNPFQIHTHKYKYKYKIQVKYKYKAQKLVDPLTCWTKMSFPIITETEKMERAKDFTNGQKYSKR